MIIPVLCFYNLVKGISTPWYHNTSFKKGENSFYYINPLNAKFNPICHLLALVGAHPIFHVSGIRVK